MQQVGAACTTDSSAQAGALQTCRLQRGKCTRLRVSHLTHGHRRLRPAVTQVCMREGAKSVPEAAYFLGSGCEPLRSGLGITGLLLPQVLASHMVNALGSGSPAIDLGNEIIWDDHDADDRKLSAAAFMNHMSVMKVCVCGKRGGRGADALRAAA